MNCRILVKSALSRRLFETIRLPGKLAARSCSTSSAVAPNRIAQTPIGLRETRTFPRAQSPTTNSISCAATLLIDVSGREIGDDQIHRSNSGGFVPPMTLRTRPR
jgi:hypothetical protein